MPSQSDLTSAAWTHATQDHYTPTVSGGPQSQLPLIQTFSARLVLKATEDGGKTRPTPVGEYRPVLKLANDTALSCRIQYAGQLEPGSETIVDVSLLQGVSVLPESLIVWESRNVGTLFPIL